MRLGCCILLRLQNQTLETSLLCTLLVRLRFEVGGFLARIEGGEHTVRRHVARVGGQGEACGDGDGERPIGHKDRAERASHADRSVQILTRQHIASD